MEDDEFLTKCVVDPAKRTFYLYSSEGDEKQVDCDNVEEFVAMMTIKGVDMDYVRNWYYQRNSEYELLKGGY